MKGRKTTEIFVSTEISVDGSAPVPLISSKKLKTESDQEAAAQKLRDKGFSYRRIADTLQVPYILVSRWLNGDIRGGMAGAARRWHDLEAEEERAARAVAAVVQPAPTRDKADDGAIPAGIDSGLGIEVLESQFKSFEKYIRGLMARFTRGQQEGEAREKRLEALVEAQKAEGDALRQEVGQLRGMVEQLMRGSAMPKPAAPAARPAPKVEEDPFASNNDPFAEATTDDPFASNDNPFAETKTDDPFASNDDPFAEAKTDDPFASNDDPFAEAKPDDPFASNDDPFAEATTDDPFASNDDPFAEATTDDPFASNDDPFAETKTDDPFASNDDPFAETKTDDPFASNDDPFAETKTDDPFASNDDPFAETKTDDPFASNDDPFAETKTDDPFASNDDPFAETKTDDPFASNDDPFAETKPDDPFASNDDPFAETKPDDPPRTGGGGGLSGMLGKLNFWKK